MLPCPACGKGGAEKTLVGVNPGWLLGNGIRVVEGIDPPPSASRIAFSAERR
jgi:hypothetical protein